MTAFTATRAAGLAALDAFVPRAGRIYTDRRNHDLGLERRDNVSVLSPYVRHRLVTEQEVVTAVLARHTPQAAEKFIQEVFWRTYWKGWLEQRPGVWTRYCDDLARLEPTKWVDRARSGDTGIDCFDAWAKELTTTGYLHNHARMWFASIWIFTLKLPWQLGADFFYHHLIDGDPASNTLSWRWVAGLQTQGKTYLARADNIARYTDGRFNPTGLATVAEALVESPINPATPLPPEPSAPAGRLGLLVTHEDMSPESLDWDMAQIAACAVAPPAEDRGAVASAFKTAALADTATRAAAHFTVPAPLITLDPGALRAWMDRDTLDAIITPHAPVGPTRTAIHLARAAGVPITMVRRPYDTAAWPHAKKGFFPFKERIGDIIDAL